MTVKSPSWRSVVANLRRMDAARNRYLKKALPKIKGGQSTDVNRRTKNRTA